MAFRLVSLALLGVAHLACSHPATTLEDLEFTDDAQSVGSYIREVRAAPPDYHHTYENDGDGEIGYSRKKNGGGKKGYQHFDSYHKKAGDNYEFEKQDSFGKDGDDEEGAYSNVHENKEKNKKKPVAEKYTAESSGSVEEEEASSSEGEGGASSEHDHSELREGESDGNGGKESYGHEKADYVLPTQYTYGEGDEYNF
ncbi:hypothetical protein JYU34_007720 [Plutella xylostella]|uniref:Uncharacterized protein n=1 Tax=Plutella xylostella TaxID=51655 RepID=A0ABQ7QR22_PLUXY|nr:hypothetical protein JYU34_007720 [Plutella xylostella]